MSNVVDLFKVKKTPPTPPSEPPQGYPRFVCQETEPKKGAHVRGTLCVGALYLIAILPATELHPWLGIACTAVAAWTMVSTLISGVPGFYRVAECLDCGTEIKIATHAKGMNCEGCQRRVVLQKDKKLRYV
ncbi:hypothetical protein AB4Z40_27255 [Bosea sp. 2YAB26]|uniref:hypothetical protein n=1 Tax=Bosea sp. 2YAB26 TaxID=3237478 RepID=UPI003F9114E4